MGRLSGGIGGKAGGGSSKSRSQNQSETITKRRPLPTKGETMITLRNALFVDHENCPVERNVTEWLAPVFLAFKKNGLDCLIEFTHGEALLGQDLEDLLTLASEFSEEAEVAAGREWREEDKEEHLTEDCARFLVVRRREDSRIIAFAHFRFTIHGELADLWEGLPCLFVYDVHVAEEYQRRGLGKHLMTMLELIGRKAQISELVASVPNADGVSDGAKAFFTAGLRGWTDDNLKAVAPKTSRALRDDQTITVFVKQLISRTIEVAADVDEEEVEADVPAAATETPAKLGNEEQVSTPPPAPASPGASEDQDEDDWGAGMIMPPPAAGYSTPKKSGSRGKKKGGKKKGGKNEKGQQSGAAAPSKAAESPASVATASLELSAVGAEKETMPAVAVPITAE